MSVFFTTPEAAPLELNRHESLLDYLETPLPTATALTRTEYDALTPAARATFDRERIAMLSGGIALATPTVRACKTALIRAFAGNSARNSGHAGVMLTGDSTMGKTTTAKTLMRWTLTEYAEQFPEWRDHDHIPVAYVEVPANATGKTLMRVFLDFLGLSAGSRDTADDLRVRVVQALRRANTQLIVVDELHNLSGRRAGISEASDVLKGLSNDLNATFLYAGIDLTTSSLMSGARGQQLAGRFTSIQLTRYDATTPEGRKLWRQLIRGFEERLGLLDHPANSLTTAEMAEYLYKRTSGSLGALSRLLTGAATDLILGGGDEHLTEAALAGFRLDHTSETLFAARKLPTTTRRTKKTAPVDPVVADIQTAARGFVSEVTA